MRDAEIRFILHGSFKNYNTNIMNFSDFDKSSCKYVRLQLVCGVRGQ